MKTVHTVCTLALAASTLVGGARLVAQASSAETDKQFLTMASQSDYTDIKFSQLAAEKAANPRVKRSPTSSASRH